MQREKGIHVLVELLNCDKILLDNILFLENVFRKAIKESNLKIVNNGYRFHKFNPQGVTGIAILSSSHIAIHTWPEKKYAALDIFACDKKGKVMKALEVFLQALKPRRLKKIVLRRGFAVRSKFELMS